MQKSWSVKSNNETIKTENIFSKIYYSSARNVKNEVYIEIRKRFKLNLLWFLFFRLLASPFFPCLLLFRLVSFCRSEPQSRNGIEVLRSKQGR